MIDKNWYTTIAGVTYHNDPEDGGESRQAILKSLPNIVSLKLIHTKFRNEPAIKIIEKKTRKVIGWIPKINIETLWSVSELTGFISETNGVYHCSASPVRSPSNQMYALGVKICSEHKLETPAYDERAYRQAFGIWQQKGYIK